MKKLRLAVIGVGSLGQHHARVCRELDNIDLVGVADLSAKRARSVARRNETKGTTDYRELISRIDAAVVAVPTTAHFDIAAELIRAGKSVLVEKPMTPTADQARRLVALAEENGVALQVGHIERFNPAMRAIDEYKISPVFIECHRLSPFKFRSADIGVVMDLMIHDLDIILHLADSPIESVDAVGINIIGRTEDLANARIRFASGCVANITASRCALKTMRKVRLFGPEAYIALDFGNKYAMLIKKSPDFDFSKIDFEGRDWTDLSDLQKDVKFEDFLTIKELQLDEFEPLLAEDESFAAAVLAGRAVEVSGVEGLRAIEAAEMVVKSLKSNAWYPDQA